MLKDLRHGVRVLLQAKGWTTVVVLSLALGIGANTALFSAVNGLLLKTVTVRDPDTLVRLKWAGRNQMSTSSSDYGNSRPDANGQDVRATFSYPMYQQFVTDNKTMTDLFACAPMGRVNVAVNGNADTASALVVTGNYFRVLDVARTRGGRCCRKTMRQTRRPSSSSAIATGSRVSPERRTSSARASRSTTCR